MNKKVAILGFTKEEVLRQELFNFQDINNTDCISMNHLNFLANTDFDQYIEHPPLTQEAIQVLPKQIAFTWYRNKKNIDNYINIFSFGTAMQSRVTFITANMIKYYFTFKNLTKNYDVIIYPKNINHHLKLIINIFGERFKVCNVFSDDINTLNDILDNRAKIREYPINKYSPYMFQIQKLLGISKTGKTLIFSDWTYKHYRNDDYLYQNSKNILNGFYTRNHSNKISRLLNKISSNK